MNKILFVELLGGLGDLVIALPAIHALALSHPQAQLTVLTFAPGSELLAADPLVQRVTTAERGSAADPDRPRQALEALLASESFDLVVSDTTYAGIDTLLESTGTRVVANLWRRPPPDQRIEERFLQILAGEGLIEPWAVDLKPRLALATSDRMWAAARFQRPGRRALLHPHAGMPIKTWPEERYIALGTILRDEFGLDILVSAGNTRAEMATARRLAHALGPDTEILPSISLGRFAAAMSYMDLVVGSDTGPVRAAAAAGALTVSLYGPTWHGRYGLQPPHANCQGYPECPLRDVADFTRQPCWYAGACPLSKENPAPGFAQWRTCVEDISVGDVLEAAQPLLDMTVWWGKPLSERTL